MLNTENGSWWSPNVSGEVPCARIGAASLLVQTETDHAKLILYGGWDYGSSATDTYFSDVRVLDTASWHWSSPDMGTFRPHARAGMRMVRLHDSADSCVVFGGRDQDEEFVEDSWLLHFDTGQSVGPQQPAKLPTGSDRHVLPAESSSSSGSHRRRRSSSSPEKTEAEGDPLNDSQPGDQPLSPDSGVHEVEQARRDASFQTVPSFKLVYHCTTVYLPPFDRIPAIYIDDNVLW